MKDKEGFWQCICQDGSILAALYVKDSNRNKLCLVALVDESWQLDPTTMFSTKRAAQAALASAKYNKDIKFTFRFVQIDTAIMEAA